MWQQSEIGKARFGYARPKDTCDWSVLVDAIGGKTGISVDCIDVNPKNTKPTVTDSAGIRLEIKAEKSLVLPPVSDSYIRGQDFITALPQKNDEQYGLTVQITVVECTPQWLICQVTIVLQTNELDTYPTLHLICNDFQTQPILGNQGNKIGLQLKGSDSSPEGCILASSRDLGEFKDLSCDNRMDIQLFGAFLEKGVIRKCHPWMVLWRNEAPKDVTLTEIYQKLSDAPLPLTT